MPLFGKVAHHNGSSGIQHTQKFAPLWEDARIVVHEKDPVAVYAFLNEPVPQQVPHIPEYIGGVSLRVTWSLDYVLLHKSDGGGEARIRHDVARPHFARIAKGLEAQSGLKGSKDSQGD